MSTSVTIGSNTYSVPAVGERSWGSDVSDLLIEVSTHANSVANTDFVLTSNFTLTDASGVYGLVTNFVTGNGTAASDGFIRMAYPAGDPTTVETKISWRDSGNTADLELYPSSDTIIQFASVDLVNISAAQTLTNKTIDADNNTISNLAHGAEVDSPSSGVHGVTGDVVGTTDTQTITNKTIDADNNTISNLAHGAEVDNPTSGVHGVTGDVVGTSDTQTITNKTIDADNNTISNLAHGSEVDSPASGVHGVTGNIVGTTDTQTITNKTIDADNNTISNLAHGAEVDDPTSGVHGVTGTVVGTSDTQTLTNKTIDADNNTISNLAHGAEVDEPSSGVHGVTGSVVGTSDTQTLTNKTIDVDSNTVSNIENDNIKAAAGIEWSKISKTGSNLNEIATRSHTDLSDKGTNTHAQIDTHISTSNTHIDHTSVNVNTAANSGLGGGGDISASRSLVLDVDNLTAETVVDDANDYVAIYDASATSMRKILVSDLITGGAGGANTALSNLSSVAINTDLLPGTTSATDLGSASKVWQNLHTEALTLYNTSGTKYLDFDITSTTVYLTSADDIALILESEQSFVADGNATGNVTLKTGWKNAGSGKSGSILIDTGNSSGNDSGKVDITTGGASSGTSGDINIVPGTGSTRGSVNIFGRTDGTSPAAGYVGETFMDTSTVDTTTSGSADNPASTDLSITLTAGEWIVGYNVCINISNGGTTGSRFAKIEVYNGSSVEAASVDLVGGNTFAASEARYFSCARQFPVSISASTTFTVRIRSDRADTVSTVRLNDENITSGFANPDNDSNLWAVRIA